MNNAHLQETAKHYAQLAEQAQYDLQESETLNEELLSLVEALCEELEINVEDLLTEMVKEETD